jgi:hypothetical protein
MESGTWACPTCTFIAAANPPVCEVCGEINPSHVPASASAIGGGGATAAAAAPAAAEPSATGEWVCSVCTCENPKELLVCAACEAPAPGSLAAADAAWPCEDCTFRNPPTATACEMCAAKPPFTLGDLEGSLGGGSGGGSAAPFVPPQRLALGGGRAAPLHLEGETPLPAPLAPQPPGAADPVQGLLRPRLLGRQLSRCIVFTRQLGHSSLKASRYSASPALRELYKTTLADEAAAMEEGVADNNEAVAALGAAAASGAGAAEGGGGGSSGSSGSSSSAAVSALQKEMAFFQSNTTNTEWNSSLFLRADEGNLLALRAAITGAEHTP